MKRKRQRAAGILPAEQSQRKQSEFPAGRRKHVGAAELREEAPPYRTGQDEQDSQDKTHPVHPVNPVRSLRFIDLFCGIGGFRIAFERAGCECVFSSDWNPQAQITYEANFGHQPHGDIHSVPDNAIPPLDVVFQADQGRACSSHAAENLAALWRMAVHRLRRDKTWKRSLKGNLIRAAIDPITSKASSQGVCVSPAALLRAFLRGRFVVSWRRL